MTNIVTNADGSITITFPPHVVQWGWDMEALWTPGTFFSIVVVAGLLVWFFAKRKKRL